MTSCPARLWLPVIVAASIVAGACRPDSVTVIDRERTFARFDWWDNRDWDWYASQIPFFESPDDDLDATYYYRWEVVTKHLTYGSPATGYVFTEFLDRPFWSGTYGAISCPLGHQFYEARWLHDRRIVEDYARYWFETPGAEPRRYSNWYGDAMWATYAVTGDRAFLRTMLPHMEAQIDGWAAERWDDEHEMFRWVGAWDGMETNINSRLTDDAFGGAEGYRPTLNSYLVADMRAVANAAAVLGDSAKARAYRRRAGALRQRIQDELWDRDREFFFHQFAFDERDGIRAKTLTYESGPYAGSPHGREAIGFVPWQFNVPGAGFESAWRFLMDPDFFAAPYGPTTVERHDPQFFISPRCCVWSGNSWPYATAQTLAALANLLVEYDQSVVTPDDYVTLLRTYARTHRLAGRPYIAEAANPDNGSWDGHNTHYHSEHYFHSGYVDLVITGLVGLRPRGDDTLVVHPLVPASWDWYALDHVSYRGHDLAIAWDRTGERYGRGPGYQVWVDGRLMERADSPRPIRIPLPEREPDARAERLHNFAVHNDGGFFPHVRASYSAPGHPPFYATDGNYWYHERPANRWSTFGTSNAEDWIEVDFGIDRELSEVRLYWLDEDEGVRTPADYRVAMWDGGTWLDIPRQTRSPSVPTGRRANHVMFPVVRTSRIRVTVQHQPGAASGLTELEAWGPATAVYAAPTAPIANLAMTATVSASYTSPFDDVTQATDGRIAFTRYSRNRWTAYDSPNRTDLLTATWTTPQRIGRIDLYLWGDDRGVAAPTAFHVEVLHDAGWESADVIARQPAVPTTWARNTVHIEPVETTAVRIVFEHPAPRFVGVTEMEIWEPE